MATSAITHYGAGAAFAAGVIATLAVVNLSGGEQPSSSQVVRPAAPPGQRGVAGHPWSDPVRYHSPAASAPRETRPPLTFTLEDSGHHSRPAPSQASSADKQEEMPPPVAQAGGPEGRAASQTKTARLRAPERRSEIASSNEPWVQLAHSENYRGTPVIVPHVAREQPAAASGAAPANSRLRITAKPAETVTRRLAATDRETRHQEAELPLNTTGARHSLAAVREARRIVPVRVTKHADAQLDGNATLSQRTRRRPQNEAPEPKRHYLAADTGGVMGWLMGPAERF